jgi:uncharacterized membrane protein
MIEWVRANVRDDDTIVEAPGCSYDVLDGAPMNRVSAFTGAPTTIGWWFHEYQWRRGELDPIDTILNSRVTEANQILDGAVSPADTSARFVILGKQEVNGASQCNEVQPRDASVAQAILDSGWAVAFRSGDTMVFARPDDPSVRTVR